MTDRLLTIADLAAMLQVDVQYVYRLNYEKRGPKCLRIGARTVRYRESDVRKWLAELEENAKDDY